jgi:hypothetical protein
LVEVTVPVEVKVIISMLLKSCVTITKEYDTKSKLLSAPIGMKNIYPLVVLTLTKPQFMLTIFAGGVAKVCIATPL